MANTKTKAAMVYTAKEAVIYLTLAYVDTATESDYLLYDSSVVATEIAKIDPDFSDPLKSRILEIYASASTASTARVWLEWDATTDVVALDIPAGQSPSKANFRRFGGITNQGGSGITGDILLNATGLSTGDIITVVLTVGAY